MISFFCRIIISIAVAQKFRCPGKCKASLQKQQKQQQQDLRCIIPFYSGGERNMINGL
jgi:hypothetical protein